MRPLSVSVIPVLESSFPTRLIVGIIRAAYVHGLCIFAYGGFVVCPRTQALTAIIIIIFGAHCCVARRTACVSDTAENQILCVHSSVPPVCLCGCIILVCFHVVEVYFLCVCWPLAKSFAHTCIRVPSRKRRETLTGRCVVTSCLPPTTRFPNGGWCPHQIGTAAVWWVVLRC